MKKSIGCLLAIGVVASAYAQETSKSMSGIQVSGFLRFRYEWLENPRAIPENSLVNGTQYVTLPSTEGSDYVDAKSQTRTMLVLNLDKELKSGIRVHATLAGERLGGGSTRSYYEVKQAFAARQFGSFEVGLGRFQPMIGLGTLGSAPDNDGIMLAYKGEMLAVHSWVTKWGAQLDQSTAKTCVLSHATYAYADLEFRPIKPLKLVASYMADISTDAKDSVYKSYAIGAEYIFAANNKPWLRISGEYAKNEAEKAKLMNADVNSGATMATAHGASTPQAWFAAAKVLGANPNRPGSYGFGIQYRKADAAFDLVAMASPRAWEVPFNWTTPSWAGSATNHKGFELSVDVAPFEGAIFKAAYGFMKTTDPLAAKTLGSLGTVNSGVFTAAKADSQNYFIAQMIVNF